MTAQSSHIEKWLHLIVQTLVGSSDVVLDKTRTCRASSQEDHCPAIQASRANRQSPCPSTCPLQLQGIPSASAHRAFSQLSCLRRCRRTVSPARRRGFPRRQGVSDSCDDWRKSFEQVFLRFVQRRWDLAPRYPRRTMPLAGVPKREGRNTRASSRLSRRGRDMKNPR